MPTANSGSRAADMHPTPHRSQVTRKRHNRRKEKRLVLKIFLGLLIAGMVAFSRRWSFGSMRQAPKLEDDKLNATVSSKLYDINNEIFEDLGAEKRELIQPNDVPQLLKDAIVSVEDRRFYKHIGVDPIRIIGSALSNVKMVDYKAEVP